MGREKPQQRRVYTKVRRAEAEEATRRRIVEALVELHGEVGPARTTVSAVAARAGVERLTVYRHFPDEASMLRACSSLYMERNEPPRPRPLDARDPFAAVATMLASVYAWYRRNDAMFSNVLRDAELVPALREHAGELLQYSDSIAADLDRLFGSRSVQRRATLRHVVSFTTWRSLSRLTRSDRAAAEIATSWVRAAG